MVTSKRSQIYYYIMRWKLCVSNFYDSLKYTYISMYAEKTLKSLVSYSSTPWYVAHKLFYKHLPNKCIVSASWSCCNKMPHTWQFRTTEIYSLIIPNTWSLNSRTAPGGSGFLRLQVFLGLWPHPWELCLPHCMAFSLSVGFLLLIRTPIIGFRACQIIQKDLILRSLM